MPIGQDLIDCIGPYGRHFNLDCDTHALVMRVSYATFGH